MKYKILFFSLVILSLNFIFALPNDANNRIDFTYPDPPANISTYNVSHADTADYATTSGSASFWDLLDTPADILGSLINNDLGWITSYTETDPTFNANLTSGFGTHLFPITTLTYDLGSGANRWRWLYVQNISADYGDFAYDVNIDGDLQVDGSMNVTNMTIKNMWVVNMISTGNITTSEWFNGKYNWTTGDTWNSFDGSTLTFNESKFATTYYNATSSQAVIGTIDGGTLEDTQHPDGDYDRVTFNFSEASGSPGLDLRVNFTGVSDFNKGYIRYKTNSLSGDYPLIQLWDYDDSEWEGGYGFLTETEEFLQYTNDVLDSSSHLQDGVVQMRLYKSANGNTQNEYYIDMLAIVDGYATPSGNVDLSPYWRYDDNDEDRNFLTDGNVTGDWGYFNNLNVTGNLYSGNVSVSEFITDFDGDEYAKYQFLDNNFNGSGNLETTGIGTFGNLDVDTLNFNGNVISDSTGTISFDNDNIETTGLGTFGTDTGSRGFGSFVAGSSNEASGSFAVCMGGLSEASGIASVSMGYGTIASGSFSSAFGTGATASGVGSVAMGNFPIAESFAGSAFGRYNIGDGNPTTWVTTDPLFEIGIGATSSTRANALTVYKNGNVEIPNGNLNITGDYIHNGNVGITGNYTNGNCWQTFSGGLLVDTNCTSI